MPRDLSRLLRPKSIALFGGGWAENVISQLLKSGFAGDIWPVHPRHDTVCGIACYRSLSELPSPPDASFIGVNREASIDVVRQLAEMGAGGATCFASGFRESGGTGGTELQERLVEAAGDMPILGPNCYGYLNYLDNVSFWPDQHGGLPVETGVGIIAQSSNIAINMTMQRRGLPLAMMVAAGNQAQTGVADIGKAMLADERITAIGLYLEGFGNICELEELCVEARQVGKPVVVLKIGRSEKARLGTVSHTASMSGAATTASALLERLGCIEVNSISVFLETLKLAHFIGKLDGNSVCSVSCSGGEASLMADLAEGSHIDFRDFSTQCANTLGAELGPIVTISNPFDYHTFIWGDTERMTRVFAEVMKDNFDLCVFVLDIPRPDRCDPSSFQCAIDAIITAKQQTGAQVAVLASLPENLTEGLNAQFIAAGVVPLHGMEAGIASINALCRRAMISHDAQHTPVLLAPNPEAADGVVRKVLSEADAKAALAEFGLNVPRSVTVQSVGEIEAAIGWLTFPVVLKGLGIAHKSEAGAVVLNLGSTEQVMEAADTMRAVANGYLIEEMVVDPVCELLVGVTLDPSGMLALTIAAGGIMTELLADSTSRILPVSAGDIESAVRELKVSALIDGYRGKPAGDLAAAVDQISAICQYVEANCGRIVELDVNPLIVCRKGAVAVDALICLREEEGNQNVG